MSQPQPGILDTVPAQGRYLFFDLFSGADPRPSLEALRDLVEGESAVVGLGHSLILALGAEVEGLRVFPALFGKGIEVPSTPSALWCWLRADGRGDLFHQPRAAEQAVSDAFGLVHSVDAFRHGAGLDLTGYEDGTENPQGEDAVAAAVVSRNPPGPGR